MERGQMKSKILIIIVIASLTSINFGGSLSTHEIYEGKWEIIDEPDDYSQIEYIKPNQPSDPQSQEDLVCNQRMPQIFIITDALKDRVSIVVNPKGGENLENSNMESNELKKEKNHGSSGNGIRIPRRLGRPKNSNIGDTYLNQQKNFEPSYSPFNYEFPYLVDLNISLEDADFFENISQIFNLTDDMVEKLKSNGFIIVNHTMINGYSRPITSFLDAYDLYWHKDLPIFITTDTILNTFHLLFDTMLKDIEKEELAGKVEMMSKLLMNDSVILYNSLEEGILKNISKEASIFFAVGAYLMNNSTAIPGSIKEDVDYYIGNIMNGTDIVLEYAYDGKGFYHDYTQYKPRGHYSDDELLRNYFRCMMWYGRKSLDMNLSNDIREAVIITKLIDDNPKANQLWFEVYNITRFLVGASDSLSFTEVKRAVMNTTGEVSIEMLEIKEIVQLIREEFQKPDYISQRILSTVVVKPPSQAFEKMDFPKIFQFMGQRYVPDSEVMQYVIYDRVPLNEVKRRGLANGLDVMTSLGSYRAVEHLESEMAYYNYSANLEYSYNLMNNMSDEFWNETTYNGWLGSYSTLISNTQNSTQPFMRTEAWADEKLNSVLGSWAELKHDTILYAKQPYSVSIGCSTPDAWVEPYPLFYQRIAELSNRTISILKQNLPDSSITQLFAEVLSDFESININLSLISEKELSNEELLEEEKDFLKSIFRADYIGCGQKVIYGWLPELLEKANVEKKTMDTRIIADVNTDPGSQVPPMPSRVLHIGLGYVENLIVLYKKPDGNFTFAIGPVYSYYEFPLQGLKRLTDNEWKDQLTSEGQKRPFWAKSFLVNEEECMVNVHE